MPYLGTPQVNGLQLLFLFSILSSPFSKVNPAKNAAEDGIGGEGGGLLHFTAWRAVHHMYVREGARNTCVRAGQYPC